jgi:integrase
MARTKPKERARKRTLTDGEIQALWRASAATQPAPFGALVRFLLLTAARREEAARLRWTDIADAPDGSGKLWTLPVEHDKTKTGRETPLSAAAWALVDALPRTGDFVFGTRADRPFGGFSKSKARLDTAMAATLAADGGAFAPWRLHDLRRTAKTLMQRAGVRPDISERVLGHVIRGVEGVYDQHSYLPEKRDALERLAGLIDTLVTPRPANVVVLVRTG